MCMAQSVVVSPVFYLLALLVGVVIVRLLLAHDCNLSYGTVNRRMHRIWVHVLFVSTVILSRSSVYCLKVSTIFRL